MIKRYESNPIIKPDDILIDNDELEVFGVFNPGAAKFNDEIILLLRVAVKPKSEKGWIKIPIADKTDSFAIKILKWKKTKSLKILDKDARFIDINDKRYLTSISLIYLARIRDGIHFDISKEPALAPSNEHEVFGVEDPRIIRIDEKYYITYTAVSENSFCTALASTEDFKKFEKLGIIFPPENKDAVFFPERINGKYFSLHRPTVSFIGRPSIWISESEDLIHWGKHRIFLTPNNTKWERTKIGAGPQPLLTDKGWLIFYHSCGDNQTYSMNLILTEKNNTQKIIGKSTKPIFTPRYKYEKVGVVPNVVFCNGWIAKDKEKILIYYGAADKYVALAETEIDLLLSSLKRV
ncbi:Putative glycosylase [Ignavibacterium album JCM 16511]|uniref:Putative glycosylase n=1 Tax=Ignavibacterium album (strain DSM 19864 / JCM 16511 / NBRC 101810 / Mat9-16) TaxID=945713 RepID=I0AHH4_IGNAJ|nr:glycoside hydrolase family 130 protein [Ignavibacterium album]AFH48431.1 Putative glycosylase [Ignavibacterium album JCM 16511]